MPAYLQVNKNKEAVKHCILPVVYGFLHGIKSCFLSISDRPHTNSDKESIRRRTTSRQLLNYNEGVLAGVGCLSVPFPPVTLCFTEETNRIRPPPPAG